MSAIAPKDSRSSDATARGRLSPGLIFWIYLLFVVYGSLVPIDFHPHPINDAWAAFLRTPYLSLGINSRADWVANGVLYVPVGFLSAVALSHRFRSVPSAIVYLAAGMLCFGLAISIEFTQIFFPPRTVSLNDIIAECAGSVLGVIAAARYTDWSAGLLASMFREPHRLKDRMLEVYVVGYLVFALFPFDLLVSLTEIQDKVSSNDWGWLIAGRPVGLLSLAMHCAAELLLTIPIGMLLASRLASKANQYRQMVILGLMIGLAIEVAQFFIASGISQGISVLTRAIGVTLGCILFRRGNSTMAPVVASAVRRFRWLLSIAYGLALMAVSGWFANGWRGLDDTAQSVAHFNAIPFYYHYFTSESRALFSLAATCLMYVPVAILAWAHNKKPGNAAIWGLGLACAIEFGKLFIVKGRADITHPLLAFAVGWIGVWLLARLFPLYGDLPPNRPHAEPERTRKDLLPSLWVMGWLAVSAAAVVIWLANFPALAGWVLLVLVVSGALVWRQPMFAFTIIAAALPVFDLAPWSGRFFLDEFDVLLFVVLTVAFHRVPTGRTTRVSADVAIGFAAAAFIGSVALSTAVGLSSPWTTPDANAFNNYLSPYNALRIAKGALWALVVYLLARRMAAREQDVRMPFARGMVLGLAITVAVVAWERVAFSGLWNYSEGYRVTGPFSSIHVGGAYIECFLAVSTPFLISSIMESRKWPMRIAGALLLLAATYTLMVTYSRNGYLAYALAVAFAVWGVLRSTRSRVRGLVLGGALACAMVLVALPIYNGDFAQARIAKVRTDLAVREAHWRDALAIRDPGWLTSLFGMGLGRFPEITYWRSELQPRASTYRLMDDGRNTFLRLASGDSMYFEQFVDIVPGGRYTLSIDLRSSRPDASMTVPICEKWMLTSYNCVWLSLKAGAGDGSWRTVTREFDAKELPSYPWYARRPVKLALYYATPNSTIDIDNVHLRTEDGKDAVENGDFRHGIDHWFFSTDGHLQWHVKSLFVGILFDQGWFGLVSASLLFVLSILHSVRRAIAGDSLAGASIAALIGFLVVGLFDTLIDAPRFLLLLLLLAGYNMLVAGRPSSRAVCAP
jgi:VanZ family protein